MCGEYGDAGHIYGSAQGLSGGCERAQQIKLVSPQGGRDALLDAEPACLRWAGTAVLPKWWTSDGQPTADAKQVVELGLQCARPRCEG